MKKSVFLALLACSILCIAFAVPSYVLDGDDDDDPYVLDGDDDDDPQVPTQLLMKGCVGSDIIHAQTFTKTQS